MCLSSSDLVKPDPCVRSTIDATIEKDWHEAHCGGHYRYLLAYNEQQLADPATPLTPAQVVGVFCKSCFTTWVENEVACSGGEGPPGPPGPGVPPGGHSGWVLAKVNSVDYNTNWFPIGALGSLMSVQYGEAQYRPDPFKVGSVYWATDTDTFWFDTGLLYNQWLALGAAPGDIKEYVGVGVPPGWLPCDGAAISRETYVELWNAVHKEVGACSFVDSGTTYCVSPGHGLSPKDEVYFTTDDALPVGMVAGQAYFVATAGFDADQFQLSSDPSGGSPLSFTGTGSGTQTLFTATVGLGDLSTTFNVPDFSARTTVGVSPYSKSQWLIKV